MSYEDSVKKLETIINDLNNKDIPLEKAVSSFKEGMDELAKCRKELENAKLIIKDTGDNKDE